MNLPHNQYESGEYYAKNPDWDAGDGPWKAQRVYAMLRARGLAPTSIVEVGCGSGAVLKSLKRLLPACRFSGFDIAPHAQRFWEDADSAGIDFRVADFLQTATPIFDLILLLDVVEHLQDPFTFLANIRSRAAKFVFHIPLDLSALSVLRQRPLLQQRRNVGHIHYYTKDLALELLRECGYSIEHWCYTGAYRSILPRSRKAALAQWPRRMLAALAGSDWAARLWGGETLMVLASAQQQ